MNQPSHRFPRLSTLLALLAWLPSAPLLAATYTVPNGPLPGGCSYNGQEVVCGGNLILNENDVIEVSSPTAMVISGDFNFGNNLKVNEHGASSDLALSVAGNLNPGNNAVINADLTVAGSVNAGNNGELSGSLVISGNLILGENSSVSGSVNVTGTLNTNNNVSIEGNISAGNVNLGENNQITGNIKADNVNINGSNTVVNGNVNATGSVNNNGTITGYINAPNVNNNGEVWGEVCDEKPNEGPCPGAGGGDNVLYYLIEHTGSALTCEAADIQVHACADANCTNQVTVTGGFELQATGPATFGANGAFSGSSSTQVQLALPQPGSYNLSIVNPDQPAAQAEQCAPSGCTIEAVETAFRWSPLATQTAGEPFTGVLRAIRTDNRSGACVAAVQGQTTVDLSVDCLNPTTCIDGGARLAAEGQSLSEQPGQTAVALTFDASGSADVALNYEDAGAIALHASKTLPNGATLTGSSNSFVVRPHDIAIDIVNPLSYPTDVLGRAGDDLTVTLTARSASGAITPNFGRETVPAELTLQSMAETKTPEGGEPGTVTMVSAFELSANGTFISEEVRYSEVGTALFTAHVDGGEYLGIDVDELRGETLTRRFVPWSFTLERREDEATNELPWVTHGCTKPDPHFSYLGQPFLVNAKVTARNRAGNRTKNYPDGSSEATARPLGADTEGTTREDLSDALTPDSLTPVWEQGVGEIANAPLTLARADHDNPTGPYLAFQLALALDDNETDGPLSSLEDLDFAPDLAHCTTGDCTGFAIGDSARLLFGRLMLADGHQPETVDMPIDMWASYWDGEGFVRNEADNCSPLSSSKLSVEESFPGEVEGADDEDEATLEEGMNPPDSLILTAPGIPGRFPFSYDTPEWLSGPEGEDATGTAYFGRFSGHDRILQWKSRSPETLP